MKNKYDAILVGAGLYNAVLATRLIERGMDVLVIEKRNHIGGNCYTENKDNIDIHRYGAHLFHTDKKEIWDFVNHYAEFIPYNHTVMANVDDTVYNLPFNMNTFNHLFGTTSPDFAKARIEEERVKIDNPKNLEEQALSMVGKTIYEKFIRDYTEKQWHKKCSELPPDIIKRIPLRFNYDNSYFDDVYVGIPKKGYTNMISKMFNGCDILTETDFLADREHWESMTDKIYYSGCIDEYYDYYFGELEYRGLKFETRRLSTDNYQGCSVMNYTTNATTYTRVIEHKWFNQTKKSDVTYITEEYPVDWKRGDIPYYPINTPRNQELYKRYKDIPNKKTTFCGRLGSFIYADMDDIVEIALNQEL